MSATSANRTHHLAKDGLRQAQKLDKLENRMQDVVAQLIIVKSRLRALEAENARR